VASRKESGQALRVVALIAVAAGLAAVTAGACALCYSSIHLLAVHAGVSASLARLYPALIDAVLVLAGCSVLALRGAGVFSRIYGWLCFLVLLAGLAAGATVHAAGIHVPTRQAEIGAAILPFVLVLAGFGLLLALLRHARQRRSRDRQAATAGRAADAASAAAADPGGVMPGAGVGAAAALASPAGPGAGVRAIEAPAPVRSPGAAPALAGGPALAESSPFDDGPAFGQAQAFRQDAAFGLGPAFGESPVSADDAGIAGAPGPDLGRPETTVPDLATGTTSLSTEPATKPGAVVIRSSAAARAARRERAAAQAGDQEAAVSADAVTGISPGAPPAPAEAGRPAVRPADLQLRARIPRQSPEQAAPEQAAPDRPAPLMPPVGAPVAESPAVPGRRSKPLLAKAQPAAAPAAGAEDEADSAMTGAADPATSPSPGAEPPALERPRSSPTPPQG
jgi:hypothetical protein